MYIHTHTCDTRERTIDMLARAWRERERERDAKQRSIRATGSRQRPADGAPSAERKRCGRTPTRV